MRKDAKRGSERQKMVSKGKVEFGKECEISVARGIGREKKGRPGFRAHEITQTHHLWRSPDARPTQRIS